MYDLQRNPYNLCLVNYEIDIYYVSIFETAYFYLSTKWCISCLQETLER
jgi:hypothetical protein